MNLNNICLLNCDPIGPLKFSILHIQIQDLNLCKIWCFNRVVQLQRFSLTFKIIICSLFTECTGDLEPPFFNPIIFHVTSNYWKIHEDEVVGTRVAEIRVNRESSPTNITYTIEPVEIADHFHVETKPGGYGNIILQKSFQGQVGYF